MLKVINDVVPANIYHSYLSCIRSDGCVFLTENQGNRMAVLLIELWILCKVISWNGTMINMNFENVIWINLPNDISDIANESKSKMRSN